MARHHPVATAVASATACVAVVLGPLFLVGQAFAQTSGDAEVAARQCASCHGLTGISANEDIPHLAGQLSRYTLNQLRNYASGRRSNGTMEALAKSMSLQDMQLLSAYFATQSMQSTGFQPDPTKVERGRRKFSEANCTYCHRSESMGIAENPRIAGQHYAYLVRQMLDFKYEKRTTNPNMTAAAQRLTEQEIEDIAEFAASAAR